MNRAINAILLLVLLIGCDFSQVNIDPNQKSSIKPYELLTTAITQSAFNTGGIVARASGFLMQHWDQQDMSIIIFPYYRITSQTFDAYWNEGAFVGLLNTTNSLILIAREKEELQYEAIAKILIAKELGTLTSSFGDIPYSRAFDLTEIKVPYDAQEEVYKTIQSLLDQAITILESSPGIIEGDLIFEGDYTKWTQTAHALKARYYMHLSKRNIDASAKAIEEIKLAFENNNSQPQFMFGVDIVAANPFAKYVQERPGSMRIHENLTSRMASTSDPRVSSYMYLDDSGNGSVDQGLFWTENDANMPLISLSELKFLEAEALLRTGDVLAAEIAMNEAVRSNLEYLDIGAIDSEDYLTTNVNFDNQITDEEKLEKVIEEKYLSLYFQGAIEIWVDYRRTGYPKLTPHPFGENELNPGGQIPERFVYVQNEYFTNEANVNNAANNIGGDLLSTKLWAFQ